MAQKDIILTGLRTNASYHLGNYLGAILPMVKLQKKYIDTHQINMFAPDLHSFTTEIEHGSLYNQTLNNLALFVASGMPIEHDNFYLYRQSFIPAHSELTVILNNFTYFGELSRMTQFKDKSADGGNITAGLFDYPVLMASDILLYGARWVPVGDDQKQHLELARDIAIRMNNKFGDLFTIPETWEKQLSFFNVHEGVRIRSLRNPEKKMSKSVEDPNGTIKLDDTPEEAYEKIKRAETDAVGTINWDWANQPGITNLLQVYEIISGCSHQETLDKWVGQTRYGDLKDEVGKLTAELLTNLQNSLEMVEISKLQDKLHNSEQAMVEQSAGVLRAVQKAVGLRQ